MVPDIVDYGLVVAYLLLLAAVAVRYRRGDLGGEKPLGYAAMCLTWLSYGLLQVSRDGRVAAGRPLNYAFDGLAIVLLVAGLGLMVKWWRWRDSEPSAVDASG